MYARSITPNIIEALGDTPVIFIRGARQVGKTTLVRETLQERLVAAYFTLDSAATLSAAASDPTGFVAGLPRPVVIDEVQKSPGLFPAIKEAVDRDRRAGQFILTGSANVLTGLRVSDSLAGRMEVVTLWPLSARELAFRPGNFIDAAFALTESEPVALEAGGAAHVICAGGYPEAIARTSAKRRTAWFQSYVTAILERDVRDLASIHDLSAMPRLLQLLASRTAQLLSYADISRSLGLAQTTLKRYMALLEATFLTWELPAWSVNIGKRLSKTPKLMFTDTGLAAALLGLDAARLQEERGHLGSLLENFVVSEIAKQATWAETAVRLYHFRLHAGPEVDLVLEDARGRIVGIEVKSTSTPRADDFKGLRLLAEACGERFVRGFVIHLGREKVPFGERLTAVPMGVL